MRLQICKLIIRDFQQFKNLELDFSHPETGEPLDKICFIGRNGTGKSTILKLLGRFLNNYNIQKVDNEYKKSIILKISDYNNYFYAIFNLNKTYFVTEEIDENTNWVDEFYNEETPVDWLNENLRKYGVILNVKNLVSNLFGINTIHIYSPPESSVNYLIDLEDVPKTNLDDALKLFDGISIFHQISPEKISDFWTNIIYQLKKRDNDFQEFLKANKNRVYQELEDEFNQNNPSILKSLAVLWDKILDKSGLYFDYENAQNPIQLTDNLKAYIKLKSNHQVIPYNQLSTGIRNFIFKIGHIYSLYFNRNIESGFLLVDEPENSLFPDFLYDLVGIYEEITQNTQIFMATHNPIIAAQFEPYERFILDFDDEGFVTAHRGAVPNGDDPNDILIKDFGIRSILGKEGVKNWERFIELKTLIPLEADKIKKASLMQEYLEIGSQYNFSPNALS
jgi:predicted ATPase